MLSGIFGNCLIEGSIHGLMLIYEKVRYLHGHSDRQVRRRCKTVEHRDRRDGDQTGKRDRCDHTEDLEAQAPDTGEWLGEAGDRGQKAPVRPAKDEQTIAEDLVKEGVDEATHHTMLAGSERSARKDQI